VSSIRDRNRVSQCGSIFPLGDETAAKQERGQHALNGVQPQQVPTTESTEDAFARDEGPPPNPAPPPKAKDVTLVSMVV
jgi:hypothetical protein